MKKIDLFKAKIITKIIIILINCKYYKLANKILIYKRPYAWKENNIFIRIEDIADKLKNQKITEIRIIEHYIFVYLTNNKNIRFIKERYAGDKSSLGKLHLYPIIR